MSIFDKFKKKAIKINSPLEGKFFPLSKSSDIAFSSEAMGKGVMIKPSVGKLLSPVEGTISVLFPTLHAIGIKDKNGVEILMHVGIDTTSLNGKGYVSHVNQGDYVKRGQLLLEFDIAYILKKGYSIETPVIITNSNDFKEIQINKKMKFRI